MKKIVLAIAAISLLQTTPVWAAEKTQVKSSQVQIQKLSLSEMKKIADKYVKQLQKVMPELKGYPVQTVVASDESWFNVHLTKTSDLQEGILYTIAINKETKKLQSISKMNDHNLSKGKLSDEDAKERATTFIKEFAGKDAKDYELLSIWREGNNPWVNFKSPADEEGKATYTSIIFGHDDMIRVVNIEIKSEAYDSWYGEDLDHRKNPGDPLSKEAKNTFDKVIELVPSLKEYPYSFTYVGNDGTYKAGLKKDNSEDANYMVSFHLDKDGELLFYNVDVLSEKAPSSELAKEKATEFMQGLYPDRVDEYEIRNVYEDKIAMEDDHGKKVYSKLMQVEFLSKDRKHNDVVLGVSDSGDIYRYYFIYQR